MPELPPIAFSWGRHEDDPVRRAEAIRKAVDFIATFLAEEGDDDKRELERLLTEDPAVGLNALHVLGAISAALVMGEAEREDQDPLDVLQRIEEVLNRSAGDDV